MISIIIPSFNSGGTIEHTLRALDTQTAKDLISETIVVDSSDDGRTKELLSRYAANGIQVVDAGIRIMPAAGRNLGAEHATGEVFVFLDADAYPADDWLENIIKAYQGGRMVGSGSVELPDRQMGSSLARAQYYLQFNEFMPHGEARVKKFVPSCNLFCDRDLFRKAGGFPGIRAAEDVLFGLNVSKITSLWFIPEAKVYHIFSEKWESFRENQKLLGRYVCIYRKISYNSLMYKGLVPVVLFPVFLCVKLVRMVSRIIKARRCYDFFTALPAFLAGLAFWSVGFINGCLKKEKRVKGENA